MTHSRRARVSWNRDTVALIISICAISVVIIACSGPVKPEEGSTVLARFLAMPEVGLPPLTQYNRSNPSFLRTREACLELSAVRHNWFAKLAFFDHPEARYRWDGQFHIWERMGTRAVRTLRIAEGDTLWCYISDAPGNEAYYTGFLRETEAGTSFSIGLSRYLSEYYHGSFHWGIDDIAVRISDENGYGCVDSLYGGGFITRSEQCILAFWAQWDAYGHGHLGCGNDPHGRW